MNIIRHRVATRAAALDDFPGLGINAYSIRERGVDGSPVNQSAPFYLWADADGMGRFLWSGGEFGAIIDSFGRPTVRHWTGVTFQPGPAQAATPRVATRHTEAIPTEADPADAVARAVAELQATRRRRRRALHRAGRRPLPLAYGPLHPSGGQRTERSWQALSGTPPQQTAHGHPHHANKVRLTYCGYPHA
jgi:Domain of unknown function (DUF4865)